MRVSVVTINYNGAALTAALIESLMRYVTMPMEIIVVDNGSHEDEAALLKLRYPSIVAIRSEENLGFAGGNNLGMRIATGDKILLLNNDTEVRNDTLHLLCDALDTHPEAGAVCPKIRFYHPPQQIQFAGYTPLTRITLRNSLLGFGRPDDGSYDTPHTTPYAHGAAMMIRREVLDRAGEMPECYFLYYEELDWSERIREAGYTILYEPRCTVFHKESATTGQSSPLRTYYITRNRLLFASRNRQGASRLLALAYQLCIAVPKNLIVELLHRHRAQAASVVRGACDFLRLKTKRL